MKTTGDAEVGWLIGELRKVLGWSQSSLARRLSEAGFAGIHQPTVARIEKGERPLQLLEAYIVADLFGITVDELSGRSTSTHRDLGDRARLRQEDQRAGIVKAIQILTKELEGA